MCGVRAFEKSSVVDPLSRAYSRGAAVLNTSVSKHAQELSHYCDDDEQINKQPMANERKTCQFSRLRRLTVGSSHNRCTSFVRSIFAEASLDRIATGEESKIRILVLVKLSRKSNQVFPSKSSQGREHKPHDEPIGPNRKLSSALLSLLFLVQFVRSSIRILRSTPTPAFCCISRRV